MKRTLVVNSALVLTLAALVGLLPPDCGAATEKYPTKPISNVVGVSAGAGVDLRARNLSKQAEAALKVAVTVENRTGASGAVAFNYLKRQPADGYTVMTEQLEAFALIVANPEVQAQLNDIRFVIGVSRQPSYFTVRANSPFKTLEDLIKYAKENPRKIKVGGTGATGMHSQAMRIWSKQVGIEVTWVPFEGGNQNVAAILGGHVDAVQMSAHVKRQYIQDGTLRPLAHTGSVRDPFWPNVPTFKEKGANLEIYSESTVVVRKDTPVDRVKVLHDAFKQAMETKAFRDSQEALGAETSYMSGEDLDKLFPTLVEQSRAELKATGAIK
jgi:tripartite-type tricarboxylate transporter receptor subunit TctC